MRNNMSKIFLKSNTTLKIVVLKLCTKYKRIIVMCLKLKNLLEKIHTFLAQKE